MVRKDLKKSSPAVQAGHAVAQYILEHPEIWRNEYLIYLSVPTLYELGKWETKIVEAGFDYSVFREPDLKNEVTAIAVVSEGQLFKNLPLMGS